MLTGYVRPKSPSSSANLISESSLLHPHSLLLTTMESNTPNVVELFISGVSTLSSTGETFPVHNAFTQQEVWKCSSASAEDVDRALESAAAAFPSWSTTSIAEKRKIFLAAADLIESPKYAARIRHAMASETCSAPGKTSLYRR